MKLISLSICCSAAFITMNLVGTQLAIHHNDPEISGRLGGDMFFLFVIWSVLLVAFVCHFKEKKGE